MQRNTQRPEKQVVGNGLYLAVNSIFYTIQGEGPFAGSPSIFVRLAGCNLQCPMCDTEYTTRQEFSFVQISEMIASEIKANGKTDLVVITGGEPFRQPIKTFVNELLVSGYRVQIETNGTLFQQLPFSHPRLTIVCSPKSGAINKNLAPYIQAYKYVATKASLEHSSDGLPTIALEHPNGGGLARPHDGFVGDVFLQPVDEQNQERNGENLKAVVNSCLKNNYRLCLQIHKLVGVD